MSSLVYKKQVSLLLSVLPIVAKEKCFALHGGTAINLFYRNMPRLSVDIDLTYLMVEDRITSLACISAALQRIKTEIESTLPRTFVKHNELQAKLFVQNPEANIKLEVNLIKRGCYTNSIERVLCEKAQKEFEAFCEIQVVDLPHVYGGKICAALDRQHPRDLFDVNYLLDKKSFNEKIKKGFIFYLISSNRPLVELLFPNFKDQKITFDNQFTGMTYEIYTYDDFEHTRSLLKKTIHASLTPEDMGFLLSIEKGEPDWSIYSFSEFPAVRWKIENIHRLKKENPKKFHKLWSDLEKEINSLT